jgi:hypothetical protein
VDLGSAKFDQKMLEPLVLKALSTNFSLRTLRWGDASKDNRIAAHLACNATLMKVT